MKTELRDKFYGNTVEEWIEKVPGELPVDAVGPVTVRTPDPVLESVTGAGPSPAEPQRRRAETDLGARTEESVTRARAAAENVLRLADEAHQRARDSHLRAIEVHRRAAEA